MRRAIAWALLAMVVLSIVPSSAFAAESTATVITAKRVQPSLIDVQLWPEDTGTRSALVVVGVIPSSTPLPAAVQLPIPADAVVTWAGEIFPEAPGKDIPVRPAIMPDGRSMIITATKSRTVQYEAQYTEYVDKGGRRTAKLAWVQTSAADKQDFSVKMPLVSDDVRITPAPLGKPLVNREGEKLYTLPAQKLKAGEKFVVSADYVPQLPQTTAPKTAWDYAIPVTLGLLGVAVVALLVVMLRSRPTGTPRDDGWDDSGD